MHYLISGGTGFIGKALARDLIKAGHQVTVLSRTPHLVAKKVSASVHAVCLEDLHHLSSQVDGVINLAGEPIVDKRWSQARKQQLRDSRITYTEQLISRLADIGAKPQVFISGSAIGYYGSHADGMPLSEDGPVVAGFTHELCRDWEKTALQAEHAFGARVCQLRTGVVLGANGGALSKMMLPFRLGLGGRVGDGRQWMSWIHLQDQVAIIRYLLAHETLSGAFNATAPGAVTNAVFSETLGKVLRRPAVLPVPAFVMQLMLGEASELLLEGQRVYPTRLLEAGYRFKHPDLEGALAAVLHAG